MQDSLQRIGTTSDVTRKDSFGTTFLKKSQDNKVKKGTIQKPDAVLQN